MGSKSIQSGGRYVRAGSGARFITARFITIYYLLFSTYYSPMTLDALIMLVGAIVAALPFLGFPHSTSKWLLFVAGVLVFALGIVVRRRLSQKKHQSEQFIAPE